MGKFGILLNFTGTILSIALAIILIWRKLYREFPFFFSYITSSILIATIRVLVRGNYRTFFEVVWGTEALYAGLALLAMHEVYRWVFLAFFKKWWFWLFFPGVVTAILILAVIYRFGSPPVQANQVMSFIISAGMAVNLVQALLFVLFFSLVAFHGIRWRDYPFGVVVGFAVIATGAFGGNWARSEFGTKFMGLFSYAPSVAYIFAVILWLLTFVRPPQPEPKWMLNLTTKQMLQEIAQYTKVIERYLGRRK